jgi:hypothetical protein
VKARTRAGQPVGPPVLVNEEDAPFPVDDLHPRPVKPAPKIEPEQELAAPLVPEDPAPCLATEVAIIAESSEISERAIVHRPSLSTERLP